MTAAARPLTLSAILAGLLGLVAVGRDGTPEAPPPRVKRLSPAEIDRLIARLGSEDFDEREAATEALKRRPEAAVALMRAVRSASNPEVKRRLDTILPVMMSREAAAKRLARLPEYVKHRQVDRFVETMVACREFLTAEQDTHVRALVKDIYTAATGGKIHRPTAEDPPAFESFAWDCQFGLTNGKPTVVDRIAHTLRGQGIGVIASERIVGDVGFFRGVALCNGDIDLIPHGVTTNSILIATGSIQIASAEASVIVCPGDVALTHGGSTPVIVTAGRIVSFGNVGDVNWAKDGGITRERDTEFFRSWELYSAKEAGVALWSAFGIVIVGSVEVSSALARAGVRPGDLLAQVNGTPVRSVRDATRLLCRATVSSGTAVLTIIRGGNRHDRVVPLYEW